MNEDEYEDEDDITHQILSRMSEDLDEDTSRTVAMALDIYHTDILLPALQQLLNGHKQSLLDKLEQQLNKHKQSVIAQLQQFQPAPAPQKAKTKADPAAQLLTFYRALADKQGRFTMRKNNRRFMDQHKLSNQQVTVLIQQLVKTGQIRECKGTRQWQITC